MKTKNSVIPCRRNAIALALALATGATQAATINVSGSCTLINAINNANSDSDTDGSGGCPTGSGADTLELEANAVYNLTAADNHTTDAGPNGLPLISSIITINGNGSTVERSSVSGTPEFRLFQITSTGNLSVNRLKLTGGKVTELSKPGSRTITLNGGGIQNDGQLSLSDCTVTANTAYGFGGGISSGSNSNTTISHSVLSNNLRAGAFNRGDMLIADSSLSASEILNFHNTVLINTSVSHNLYSNAVSNFGNLTLTNSTVSGNQVEAIFNYGSSMQLINTTVSNNNSSESGATIENRWGFITLINSTVSSNSGNGISNFGVLTLTNSIVANNTGADCNNGVYFVDRYYTFVGRSVLQGTNLIEDGSCDSPLIGDPKLAPLLDNGGPTLTHYFGKESPAIDAADNAFCSNTDQRGVLRPQPSGGNCDLGAVEHLVDTPDSVKDIVQFFNRKITKGSIVGIGTGQVAYAKTYALRRQLKSAGNYREQSLTEEACAQLARTLVYIDTDNSPDDNDYVTGSAASALADEITDLRVSWACL